MSEAKFPTKVERKRRLILPFIILLHLFNANSVSLLWPINIVDAYYE